MLGPWTYKQEGILSMIYNYEISGMHCQNCVDKLTKAIKNVPEVQNVTVTLIPPHARVEMKSNLPVETFNQAAKAAGNYSFKEVISQASIPPATELEVLPAESLTPLFIVGGYILGGVFLRAAVSDNFSLHTLMNNSMGGFFILFSLFKMLDLSGFADGYSTYDVVAKHSRAYALAYPFIELVLGILYFTSLAPFATNLITLILMIIGSIGVVKVLMEKRTIQCACLGTALKLPMTKVTLIEDALMGLMALVMLMQ